MEKTLYKLKQGEAITVNGLLIENKGVQSVEEADHQVLQHLVTLLIKPANGPVEEFSTIIVEDAAERGGQKYLRSRMINAYGNEIDIRKANGFMGQDIEFTVTNL